MEISSKGKAENSGGSRPRQEPVQTKPGQSWRNGNVFPQLKVLRTEIGELKFTLAEPSLLPHIYKDTFMHSSKQSYLS